MRNKAALSGNLRVVLWAALVVAAGALLAGLCGIGLARALPAGGTADPLPVYTSLSLAAEDEPLLPVWQRYDPEQVTDTEEEEVFIDLGWIYAYMFWPMGIYDSQEEVPQDPLAFKRLVTEDILAYYLLDYPLPDTLLLTNLYSGRMVEQTDVRMDLALGQDSTGTQISLRLRFPGEAAARASQLDQAVELVQNGLCEFLGGERNTLLGISAEGWYFLTEGTPFELLDRLQNRPLSEMPADTSLDVRLQQLCDELMLDAQIIRLENEVLLTLTDRYGSGMLCIYYDARLCCVSGVAIQMV